VSEIEHYNETVAKVHLCSTGKQQATTSTNWEKKRHKMKNEKPEERSGRVGGHKPHGGEMKKDGHCER